MDAVKLLKSLLGNNAIGGNLLGSMLRKVTGGSGAQSQSAGGGMLGSLVGGLLGSRGTGGMLGSLIGGGLLGSLLGGGDKNAPAQAMSAPAATEQATLLIRAMCNAAKADGEVDQDEQQNIIGRLGDEVDQAEIDFVNAELNAALDVTGFAASVPADLAATVYTVSLMTIKVDTPEEAQYLRDLAQGLKLDQATVSDIHKELGAA